MRTHDEQLELKNWRYVNGPDVEAPSSRKYFSLFCVGPDIGFEDTIETGSYEKGICDDVQSLWFGARYKSDNQ